jgi:dihydropyrimidine dehydrogenase (NAD+) subunit PreT
VETHNGTPATARSQAPQGPHITSWLFAEAHPPLARDEAIVEAEACLQCGGPYTPAPCTVACPSAIDVPGFIREIAAGRPLEAARIIFNANILGGTCARVCPVEELCQGACVLEKRGRRAIQIGRLQRFATDSLEDQEAAGDLPPATPTGPSVGVIGAGPAGLACAAELARLGYSVVVYERRTMPGGLVVQGIAPYKQVVDPLPSEVERLRRMGVEFRYEVQVGRDITPAQLRERHMAVFLGAGLGKDVPAQLPGEDLPGVWDSLEFIERIKLGRARPMDFGRRVVVIGGGNTAIDVAREAVRLALREVTVLYRRDREQMPAYRHELEAARREGVRLVCLAAPLEFLGDGRVQAVRCMQMRLGEPDASGRPRPVPIAGSEFILEADMVIKAIGQQPLTHLFQAFGVEMQDGRVRVDHEMRTSQRWCYAGGDCVSGGATVVDAVRDGKNAAQAIHRTLSGIPRCQPARPPAVLVLQRGHIISYMQGSYELGTAPSLCKGCSLCLQSCPAGIIGLDAASRVVISDANKCVFCGICEDRCPDFAIWIHKDAIPARTRHTESEVVA